MNESSNSPEQMKRLSELMPRMLDQELSREESDELVQILQSSVDAKKHYLSYLQVHSELGTMWGSGNSIVNLGNAQAAEPSEEPKPPVFPSLAGGVSALPAHYGSLVAWLVAITCALSVALIVSLSGRWNGQASQSNDSEIANATGANEPERERPSDLAFTNANNRPNNAPDVAVVVRSDDNSDEGLVVGRRLKPGLIQLGQGSIQIEFMGGAVLALSGPGELEIHSRDAATLLSGGVSVNVPERARGFVLNAPDAAIYDLGTEFSVNVNPEGASEVEVTSGEIELSLLGNDGNTLTTRRVLESTRMRVDGLDRSFVLLDSVGSAYSEISTADDSGLPINDRYVAEIVQGEPVFYCRFEEVRDGSISNHMSDRFSVRADPADKFSDSIRLTNGHVQFRRTEEARHLIMDESIESLNEGPYSIELWMKPDDLQHATCLGVFPDSRTNAAAFINVIEIVTDTFMIHDPGAIRFLHRSPPGREFAQGTNAFTPGLCVPGQWHHIVAVKTDTSMEVYVNGKRLRSVDLKEDMRHGSGDFQLVIGQLRDDFDRRQFSGALDELAIYKRALTPAEVARHFELIDVKK